MNSPEWEPLERQQLHTNRIVPVYGLTAGVTPKWLRRVINAVVLRYAPCVVDPLPDSVRASTGLTPPRRRPACRAWAASRARSTRPPQAVTARSKFSRSSSSRATASVLLARPDGARLPRGIAGKQQVPGGQGAMRRGPDRRRPP